MNDIPSQNPLESSSDWPVRKQICNGYEQLMLEVFEENFPPPYKCYPQVRLASVIELESRLSKRDFETYTKLSIDILIVNLRRVPILAIECQSKKHDSEDAKRRDELKLKLLREKRIPVLYTRPYKHYISTNLYRAWNPVNKEECIFDINSSREISGIKKVLGISFYLSLDVYENNFDRIKLDEYKNRQSYEDNAIENFYLNYDPDSVFDLPDDILRR